jgi:hypothetical protein
MNPDLSSVALTLAITMLCPSREGSPQHCSDDTSPPCSNRTGKISHSGDPGDIQLGNKILWSSLLCYSRTSKVSLFLSLAHDF